MPAPMLLPATATIDGAASLLRAVVAALAAPGAKAQIDASLRSEELRIKAFEAETDRIKVSHEIQQPSRFAAPSPSY